MATSSFITIKNALEQFAENHLSVRRFKTSFFEQIDNFSSSDNTFPILYAIPSDVTFDQYVNRYFFRVYCVDVLQKDRSNESAILNDTLLILRDLYNWLKISDNGLNTLSTSRAIPVNNFLVDYTTGWYIDIEVEATAESNDCSIPFSENFILTGYTCDYTYVNQFLTCETLEQCQAIIDINNQIDAIVVSADTFVVNGSYDNHSGTLTLVRNDGNTLSITGFTTGATGSDIYVTGGTFNQGTETLTLSRNDNQSIVITGFTSGGINFDVFVTGGTYNAGSIEFTNNTGGTFTVTGIPTGSTSGGTIVIGGEYLPLSGGTVTGATTFTSGVTSNIFQVNSFNTIAVTNQLDTNTGIMWDGPDVLSIHNGGRQSLVINAAGAITNGSNAIQPGFQVQFTGNTLLDNLTATTISATTYLGLPLDIYVTGGTYNNITGTATFTNNTGGTFNVTGFNTGTSSTFTGGTVTGPTVFTNGLSANTFSASTYLGLPVDIRVTGATKSGTVATFTNNTGGTFTLTGLSDTFVTGGTYNGSQITFTNNTGGTFNVTGFTNTTGGIATWSQGADGTLVSGTTANTVTYSQLISGGTMGNGSLIRINFRSRTTINASTTMRIYINTTPDLTGSPVLVGGYNNAGATSFLVNHLLRTLVVKNASNNTETYVASGVNQPTDLVLYNSVSTLNINWAVDQYIVFAVQNPASTTQSAVGSYYLIEKI